MSPKNGHPLGPGMSSNERTPSGSSALPEFNRQPNRFSSFPKGLKSQTRAAMTKPEQNKYSESSISQKEKRTTVRVRTWHKNFKRPYDLTKYLCCQRQKWNQFCVTLVSVQGHVHT